MAEVLPGIGVGPGYAAGPLYRVAPTPPLPPAAPVADPAAEADRAVAALAAVAAELTRRAGSARGKEAADILQAEAMMAGDPVLRDAVTAAVHDGADAVHAIDTAFAAHRREFLAAGGFLAERVTDLDDLRDRAVAVCLDRPMPGVPEPGHPFVLAAEDLAPAETAGLDPELVLALVTEAGGPTGHSAIVARSLGLPAVVRCAGILAVPDGTEVAVDGTTGEVQVAPDPAAVVEAVRGERDRRARLARSAGPGRTADGHPVALLANIGSARDLPAGREGTSGEGTSGEGVGLFRTELLYLGQATAPTREEQVAAYTEVFAAAGDGRVVVRTLDAGADKPVPFLHQPEEPNPALGVRGLRLDRRHPEVLDDQLAAVAEAAAATGAQVWVMAPMVATVAEAAGFVARCRAHGLHRAGAMIEVPAAALRARQIAGVVDFLSIGTNDLSQYAFAADRQCGELADLLDPWQPASLQLIAACAEAGRATDTPVGVCGEAAADPVLAPVLAGFGISSLSMAPAAIPAVREALAARTLAECHRLAEAVLRADDPAAARAETVGAGQRGHDPAAGAG